LLKNFVAIFSFYQLYAGFNFCLLRNLKKIFCLKIGPFSNIFCE